MKAAFATLAAVAARANGEAAQEAEAPAKADAVSETETWNEGVECYRAGDTTIFWILAAISACAAGIIGIVLFILSKKRKF